MAPTTTSATWHGRNRRRPSNAARFEGAGVAAACLPARRPLGFTLLEVLLAIALVVVLVSLVVGAFSGLYESEQLGEGSRKLDSVLRMARADAASQGRRVRMAFDPQTLQPSIVWEPKPLEEPGVFVPYTGAGWAAGLPNDLVRVRRCQRIKDSAVQTSAFKREEEPQSADGKVLHYITFYPDGTCDSAIVELAGLADSELRIGRIDIEGATGTFTLRILTPTEQQEQESLDAEAGIQ
jgi:prepilin-type N-terminal cleavage/methylation domain-containing protein